MTIFISVMVVKMMKLSTWSLSGLLLHAVLQGKGCVFLVFSVIKRSRPLVVDVGSRIKYDPPIPVNTILPPYYSKLEGLYGKTWEHGLGDGKALERLVDDLLERLDKGTFRRHKPEDYHLKIASSYKQDGL